MNNINDANFQVQSVWYIQMCPEEIFLSWENLRWEKIVVLRDFIQHCSTVISPITGKTVIISG